MVTVYVAGLPMGILKSDTYRTPKLIPQVNAPEKVHIRAAACATR